MKAGHKPGSVHSYSLENEWVIIYLGLSLPIASSGTNQEPGLWPSSVPRLAPSRGLPSQPLSMLLVRSYRTFAPLPYFRSLGRYVSVALSSRFPALGITQQAWPSGSPDFPQKSFISFPK